MEQPALQFIGRSAVENRITPPQLAATRWRDLLNFKFPLGRRPCVVVQSPKPLLAPMLRVGVGIRNAPLRRRLPKNQ